MAITESTQGRGKGGGAGNGSGGERGETEVGDDLSALDVLLDGDIDKVMTQLDKVVEAAPSYRKLISRWENQGWSSESFDFTRDVEEWNSGLWTDEERKYMQWSLSSFFLGEERVTTELLPFAIAAPTDDQRIFLASQVADEARHCVFFDASSARCSAPTRRRSPRTWPRSARG